MHDNYVDGQIIGWHQSIVVSACISRYTYVQAFFDLQNVAQEQKRFFLMNFTKKNKYTNIWRVRDVLVIVMAVHVNELLSSIWAILTLRCVQNHQSILSGSVMRSRWLLVMLAEYHIVHSRLELTFCVLTSDTRRNTVAGVSYGPLVKPDALLSIRPENEYVSLFTCSISWTSKPTWEDPSVQPVLVPAC